MTYSPPRKAHKWEKFNFEEWLRDPCLRLCSRAARSLWLDMCGLIYAADAEGRLEIAGRAPTHVELARLFDDHPHTVKALLNELRTNGVFDEDEAGFVVSRRIHRELMRRSKDRENGRLGGNPSLVTKDKPSEGVKAKRPEARSQTPEGLAGLVGRGLSVLGPGAVDHRADSSPRKSLESLLPDWIERWDFELDILPVLEAQTRAKRPKPLRFFTRLSEDIADHHERRIRSPHTAFSNSAPQNSELQKLPDAPLAYPDGSAGDALRAVVARKGPAWARSWLGEATWNGTEVYVATELTRQRVEHEVGRILKDHGYDAVKLAP